MNGDEPLEITTFYPREVEVIDPRRRTVPGSYYTRRSVRSNRRVALALFLATCVSVFLAGLVPGAGLLEAVGEFQAAWQRGIVWPVWEVMVRNGALYFGAVMTILIAHEMGHFLQAKRYRVPATLPYFIPFPITPFGTMGAVIIQGAGVADRKSLFDIAISGPLAGLVFALPITAIGIHQADFVRVDPVHGGAIYGDPLVLQWMSRWIHGPMPEHHELHLNALLFAGWVGIFITALNLMPIGQLDGGHILYTLIGRRAHRVAIALLFAAMAFMFLTGQVAYALMVVLLFMSGPRHPPTANDNVPLGAGRLALGWLTLAFVIIGFTPVPISFVRGVEQKPTPPVRSEAIEVRLQPSLITRPSGSS